jgi:hypothetical protein
MSNDLRDDAVERLIKIAGPRPAVRADVAARVKANVRDAWRAEVGASRTRGRFIWTLPLAAAIATAVVLTITHTPQTTVQPWVVAHVERVTGATPGLKIGASVIARSTIVTTEGRASFRLADGTSLRLDTHSRLRFDTPHRLALESGAVYIDTARRGIRLQTPFGLVRDIGTRFEVRLTPASARIRVRNGEVVFMNQHAHRGEQLDVVNGEVKTSRTATWGDEWDWAMELAPPFELEGAHVTQFLAWVSGETGLDVIYDSPATAHRAEATTMHGSRAAVRPDVAAKAFLPTAGLQATIRDGVITVRQ